MSEALTTLATTAMPAVAPVLSPFSLLAVEAGEIVATDEIVMAAGEDEAVVEAADDVANEVEEVDVAFGTETVDATSYEFVLVVGTADHSAGAIAEKLSSVTVPLQPLIPQHCQRSELVL